MQTIKVTPPATLALILATSQYKPKSNAEFYDAHAITKAMRPLFEERINGDRAGITATFPTGETRDLMLESSAFRLLKTAFEAARDGGTVYTFAQAEMVVAADEALKGSTNGTPDPVK